jgi:hypothetical protein
VNTAAWFVGIVAFVMIGVVTLAVVVKLREVRAAASWPAAKGRVRRAGVQPRQKKQSRSTLSNVPAIEYEYEVAGRRYTGSRITLGETIAGGDIAPMLERYWVGAPVTVFYDPSDPSKAVLERDPPEGLTRGIAIMYGILVVGGAAALATVSGVPRLVAPRLANPTYAVVVTLSGTLGVFVLIFAAVLTMRARSARGWTKVGGTIVASRTRQFENLAPSDTNRTTTHYEARVVYAYTVGRHTYHGDRVTMGGAWSSSLRSFAERRAARYPVDQPVVVYVDPSNPAEAVLEPRAEGAWALWAAAVLLLLTALFFAT